MTLNNKVRDNIILTTVQNVWKKGYAATSVQEIIKKADAPKGSIYYYFPKGKDEIFLNALDKINHSIKKEFRTIENKNSTLEQFLTAVFDLFITKGRICRNKGFSLTHLALETIEIAPIISEKCSELLENWRFLLADALFDRNIPEELCNPISEWLFTSIQGAVSASKLHDDDAFLDDIRPCINFITMTSNENLLKIFSKADTKTNKNTSVDIA